MDTPDTAIITVVCADEGVKIDMELPTSLSVGKVKGKILEALRNVYAGKFLDWSECQMIYANRILKDEETLSGVGAFDGQYLNIVR